MSSLVLAALIGWLIALVIFLGFIALLRYIDHRERMALIARGMDPNRLRRHRRGTGVLRAGESALDGNELRLDAHQAGDGDLDTACGHDDELIVLLGGNVAQQRRPHGTLHVPISQR